MRRENRHRRRRQAERKVLCMLAGIVLVFGASLLFYIRGQGGEQKKTMGNVDFYVSEPLGDKLYENGTTIQVKPGQSLAKDPTITIKKHSALSYLRARILFGGLDMQEREELEQNLAVKSGWLKNPMDGYYYYQYPVSGGDKVCFFDTLTIPESWEGREGELCFCLEIDVEAAQMEYIRVCRDENQKISGWTKIS